MRGVQLLSKAISDLLGPFSPFSPYGRYSIVDYQSDPFFPIAQETLPWQPMGKDPLKLWCYLTEVHQMFTRCSQIIVDELL